MTVNNDTRLRVGAPRKQVIKANKILPNHDIELARIDGSMQSNIDLTNYSLDPGVDYTEEQNEPPNMDFPDRKNRRK